MLFYRTRVPGFSNCSLESLKRLNDWCLYNVPAYKVISVTNHAVIDLLTLCSLYTDNPIYLYRQDQSCENAVRSVFTAKFKILQYRLKIQLFRC